jgi:hypothetical protein
VTSVKISSYTNPCRDAVELRADDCFCLVQRSGSSPSEHGPTCSFLHQFASTSGRARNFGRTTDDIATRLRTNCRRKTTRHFQLADTFSSFAGSTLPIYGVRVLTIAIFCPHLRQAINIGRSGEQTICLSPIRACNGCFVEPESSTKLAISIRRSSHSPQESTGLPASGQKFVLGQGG